MINILKKIGGGVKWLISAYNQDLWRRITMETMENLDVKNTINIKNNSMDSIDSRLDTAKEKTSWR